MHRLRKGMDDLSSPKRKMFFIVQGIDHNLADSKMVGSKGKKVRSSLREDKCESVF
jgi:hypothetical protein